MKKTEKGQTLIEGVFVIAVTGLILSGLATGIIYFARVARMAKYRSWAANLAQEKLEDWRSMKETDPDEFWQTAQTTQPIIENLSQPAEFTRTTTFDYQEIGSTRRVRVTIEVSWRDNQETREVQINSYFTD